MNRVRQLTAAAVLFACTPMGAASAATNGNFYPTAPAPSISPLLGYYIWGNDSAPRGFSIGNMDGSNNPIPLWDLAVDPGTGDLFIYNRASPLNSQMLRVRADTGQVVVGRTTGRPTSSAQVDIWASSPSGWLDGLGIETWGYQNSLDLLQQSGSSLSRRTAINFNNLFAMGTDTGSYGNPVTNWYLADEGSGQIPLLIDGTDELQIRNGAQIAGQLYHTGGALGFYGAIPVGKQAVSGCRTDGTALTSLMAALRNLGLITDQTTP